MGQSRESSLVFSLKDLEALEQDRIRKERAERDAHARAERLAEVARIEQTRDEERRRLEADERARQADERLRREETARLDALGRAAVERARAEVEVRAAAELERAREQHELALATTRAGSERRRERWMLVASAAALVFVSGLAAALSTDLRRAEKLDDDRFAALTREREACARVRDALGSTERARDDLERRVVTLGAPRPAMTAPPIVPATPLTPNTGAVGPRGHRHVEATAAPPSCTGDGDPLNGCLPRP